MFYYLKHPVSHSSWRRYVKNEQRRNYRRKVARERDEALAVAHQDPQYQEQQQAEEAARTLQLEIEHLEREQRRVEWQARDFALHSLFVHHKRVQEERERIDKEQQDKIKQEWESKKKKEAEAKCAEQMAESPLLQQARLALHQNPVGDHSTNPEPPRAAAHPNQNELCPFFSKTGACRFGARCSRQHVLPPVSCTLLLPHFYVAPGELPGSGGAGTVDSDADATLEYDEQDRRRHFREFFEDVCGEAARHGGLQEVRVCCNTATHLRGNVYLRYERTSDAVAAAAALHGRYYAGRIVTCIFVPGENFRAAVCGLYWRNLCPKGGACNFLHPHPNPDNQYTGQVPDATRRNSASSLSSRRSHRISSYRRSRSRSPRSSSSRKSNSQRSRRSNSPRFRTKSPRSRRSKSPRSKRSKSPRSKRSKSPRSRTSQSPRSRRSKSPARKWSKSPRSRKSMSPKPIISKSPKSERLVSPRRQTSKPSRSNLSDSNSSESFKRSASPVLEKKCHCKSKSTSERSRKKSRSSRNITAKDSPVTEPSRSESPLTEINGAC